MGTRPADAGPYCSVALYTTVLYAVQRFSCMFTRPSAASARHPGFERVGTREERLPAAPHRFRAHSVTHRLVKR